MDKFDPNLPVPVGALKEVIEYITKDIYSAIDESNEATADMKSNKEEIKSQNN